ncbi:MAG TPA: hypothetical protein VFH54_15185 [Mycobacteriales bacterium]|nr:hypothetical protein [Mycobacteriales bacterium]
MAVSRQINQALLAHVQLFELPAVASVEFVHQALLVGRGLANEADRLFGERLAQLNPAVIALNGIFDQSHRQMRQVAEAILPGTAHVVGIRRPAAALDLGIDHPAGPARLAAAIAEQQTFEVVEVHPVALAIGTARRQHVLHPIEQLLVDDGGVAAGEDLPLIHHDTRVVRIAQHPVQLAGRQRLGRRTTGGPSGQPHVSHGVVQPVDGVVAGRVPLPGGPHEGRSLLVQSDAVDHPALVLDADVPVADACPADGAAVLGLVPHLDPDVLAAHADLDLVDDVGDGLHGVRHDALPEVLLG